MSWMDWGDVRRAKEGDRKNWKDGAQVAADARIGSRRHYQQKEAARLAEIEKINKKKAKAAKKAAKKGK